MATVLDRLRAAYAGTGPLTHEDLATLIDTIDRIRDLADAAEDMSVDETDLRVALQDTTEVES